MEGMFDGGEGGKFDARKQNEAIGDALSQVVSQ